MDGASVGGLTGLLLDGATVGVPTGLREGDAVGLCVGGVVGLAVKLPMPCSSRCNRVAKISEISSASSTAALRTAECVSTDRFRRRRRLLLPSALADKATATSRLESRNLVNMVNRDSLAAVARNVIHSQQSFLSLRWRHLVEFAD